jgi:hypothetical protein
MYKLAFLVLVVCTVCLGGYFASQELNYTAKNAKSAIKALGGRYHYDAKLDRFSYVVIKHTDELLMQRLNESLEFDDVGKLIFSDCLIDFRKPGIKRSLESVEALTFRRCEFVGFRTKGIQMESVQSLSFEECEVPEDFLTGSFAGRLSRLRLLRSRITDDAFANLLSSPNLKLIHLINNSPLSGKGLNCLSEQLGLEKIYILRSDVNGLDFTDFRSSIRQLDLGGSNIGSREIKSSRHFNELESLNVSGTRIDDDSMDTIEAFKNLVSLGIAHTKVTRESVAVLERLSALQTLYIDAALVDSNDFPGWERLLIERDGVLQLSKQGAEGHQTGQD